MEDFKGTKGRWNIGNLTSVVVTDDTTKIDVLSSVDAIDYYGGHLICESVQNSFDAKLIAAAPELLDAAIKAYTSIRHSTNPSNSQLEAYHSLEKAIEKATKTI